jgi:hypothetical protein
MPQAPKKLRKQYENTTHPEVVLRFEDGHEIHVPRGVGKSFEIFSGESVRLLAVYDKTSAERELIETRKADQFADAK